MSSQQVIAILVPAMIAIDGSLWILRESIAISGKRDPKQMPGNRSTAGRANLGIA
jgi:hypothetical protein